MALSDVEKKIVADVKDLPAEAKAEVEKIITAEKPKLLAFMAKHPGWYTFLAMVAGAGVLAIGIKLAGG